MSRDLLFDVLTALEELSEPAPLDRLFARLSEHYGLSSIAYLGAGYGPDRHREPMVAATYSLASINPYKARNYVAIDPVVQMGMRRMLPIDWNEFHTLGDEVRTFFGEAVEFGLGRQGLSIPVHGRHGDRALFSVTSDASDRVWHTERQLYMRDFQVLAVHLHATLLRLEGTPIGKRALSPRERECLTWIAEGKTAWECAMILGLSESTVRCYLESARHKLTATSNTHAVAKAIKGDLLSNFPW